MTISTYKKIFLIYVPVIATVLISLYVSLVYVSWVGDKEEALNRLSRYKKLIDRTEELKEGYQYSYSAIDLSAKVVDIPTRIYDRNNELIGEFFEQKREIVPYSYIPQWLVNAVISSEDRDFYKHDGVSIKGIARAMLVNMKNFRVVQGGSTITQQLAKVLFTDMERNLKRKIYEAFCAVEIEKRYDKADILSMYLNLIYFGNGAYGVESAAKMFYGMSVRDLNETECAMIVATISNPSIYSPLLNLSNSLKRTKTIMNSMVEAKYMQKSAEEVQLDEFIKKWEFTFDEKSNPTSSFIGSSLYSSYRVNRAPFFIEQIRKVLVEKFGDDVVKKGGLSVYTTIDGPKQDVAEEALKKGIEKQREYHQKLADQNLASIQAGIEEEKAKNIEGAMVAINPETGEIISYVGGYSFSTKNQLDHVSQIKRQPGSSFKPMIYAAAVQDKTITPSSVFTDERTVFEGDYSPKNYADSYQGKVIAREALKKSINTIAVQVLNLTGYDTLFKILENALNLSSDDTEKRFGKTLSLALGTYEVSPLENCVLHSTIVNNGKFIEPFGLKYVKDYNGNIIWDNQTEIDKIIKEKRAAVPSIIEQSACAVAISMLKGVFEPEGTGYNAIQGRGLNFPIAGKTGTSSDYSDAWFIGYTKDIVTAIWIGNNKGAISLGKGRTGGSLCAPVWAEYISKIYIGGDRPLDFDVPEEGVTTQIICLESGLVPRRESGCRLTAEQLFLAGTEPGQYCDIHNKK